MPERSDVNDDALSLFHPVIQDWFRSRFNHPTDPQQEGWPHIASGDHTLIAAPTGSGKTLTAFLAIIDRLFRDAVDGKLEEGLQVVYLSPLRALSNDMERNLTGPLQEIHELAIAQGFDVPPIQVGLRTGDTTSYQRSKMVKKPPHILVTTPESLFLLLTGEKSRESLRTVKTVIVDEIHALVRDKRGSHMALSIERLEALVPEPLQRIGLSATQKPISRVAEFLVGDRPPKDAGTGIDCQIVDVGHTRDLDLAVEIPPSELSCVCSHEQWAEVNHRIVELINEHRSTLIFVNTRRLAERLTHQLSQILGEDAISSHHGSLSKEHRLSTEQRLKSGELKAVVATASLELGIDVGYIDLVIQIGSPRSIAAFLQRIGRSGHALGLVPRGRLFALTRDELIECLGLIRAVKQGRLDVIPIPEAPLDILAQQIVGEVCNEEWDVDEIFNSFTRASPYRNLSREDFDRVIHILSNGLTEHESRGRALIHHDHVNGIIKPRKASRLIALNNSGAIAEIDSVRVILEDENTVVGSVDEDFAVESSAGDIFLLGNSSWRIQRLRGNDLIVADAHGAPPTIPFWRGEAPGRTIELSEEVSNLRAEIESRLIEIEKSREQIKPSAEELNQEQPQHWKPLVKWLQAETECNEFAAWQIVTYIAAQRAAIGVIPTTRKVVFERFFDESGGMQLVVHAPFGGRINRAWGLAFRKRFCRSFDFELQASADDDGFILSLGPQHSFPIESLFPMMRVDNAQNLLEQALLVVPMFHLRWRWNVTRSLFVARMKNGKKVPPALQRFRTEDLLTAVFPKLTGCQENIVGDHEIPDHPIVKQTMEDCLREALDIDGLVDLLRRVDGEEVTYVARDTREPSPFAYELLNANPYAFLDGGEVQERRARAVSTRRSLNVESVRDLGKLDPEAIRSVVDEVQPLIRNEDELHDALVSRFLIPVNDDEKLVATKLCFQSSEYLEFLQSLNDSGRIIKVIRRQTNGEPEFVGWVPVERWPAVSLVWKDLKTDREVNVPSTVKQDWNDVDSLVAVLRGLIETSGPVTAVEIASALQLPVNQVFASLVALEGEGIVLRGRFLNYDPNIDSESEKIEWCHRRLLARIHRRTISGLRKEIEAVEIPVYHKFLARHHGAVAGHRRQGADGVFESISQLQGLDLSSAAWEESLLPLRVEAYVPAWLDELCLTGDISWGRLDPVTKKRTAGKPMASVTRAVPISLFLREDLPWLTSRSHDPVEENLGDSSVEILELLRSQGALFARDLLQMTNLLPTQLDERLGELVSRGWITADGFAGLRKLTRTQADEKKSRRRSTLHRERKPAVNIGRWTLWNQEEHDISDEEVVEQWAWQLIRRWGVVFRDLVLREPLSPQWWELLRVYRRLEARGEIRGGRFIKGVGGEQFATGEAIRELRTIRDTDGTPELTTISAADPLNLTGIIGSGKRIPGLAGNRVSYLDGEIVGWKKGDEHWIADKIEDQQRNEILYHFGLPIQRVPIELELDAPDKNRKPRKKRRPNRDGSGIPKPFPF
ncbi:DEAD/DEAH box helicase [Thalassoglobus sp.]|uniref:DEAD/DEAH box helicase n=1 Tax=Thalassoglobus sp. TaxID=2795869 RepID=UPI003AA800DD